MFWTSPFSNSIENVYCWKKHFFYLKFLLSRWFSAGWGGGGWTGWVRRAVSLTTLYILKVLAHQMNSFFLSLLTSNQNFLYIRKWFPDLQDAFSKSKIHVKSLFASLETLINFKCCSGSRINIFVSALLLCYWPFFPVYRQKPAYEIILWITHCNENPIFVFLFRELPSPNFHIHVSVSDLYIPRISHHISCSRIGIRQIDRRNI